MLLKGGKEYICSCYYKKNIFLKAYNLHVTYENKHTFEKEFRQVLRFKGCSTDKQFEEVLDQISVELQRRKAIHQLVADRTKVFREIYQRLHPDIWQLKESHFDRRFLSICKEAKSTSSQNVLQAISKNGGFLSESFEVYQFPVLNTDFCRLLMEEVVNFKATPEPKTRPNTMNRFGISLDEMGLSEKFLVPLVQNYLTPICAALYPSWGGASIDSFKASLVNYEMGRDIALDDHFDNAEITINISLTENFEEGDISFGHLQGEVVEEAAGHQRHGQWIEDFDDDDDDNFAHDLDLKMRTRLVMSHELGHGILHCGRRMHKALPITAGSRTNLIIWMRSSKIRNHLCPMCGEPPSLMSVPALGEGFTLVDVCSCS